MNPIQRLNLPCLAAVIVLLANLVPASAVALPEDRSQPIQINADRAVRNDKTGVTQLIGNATLSQGSLTISADQITINYEGEGIRDILATGEPAVLQQTPAPDQQQITAKANRIEYRVSQELVHLKEGASIDQDGSVITSDLIRYDINQSLAEAGGDDRVNIVIPPNKTQTDD